MRFPIGLGRHEIHHTAIGVLTLACGLRPADYLDMVERLSRDMREIETASERVHRYAIDLHKREIRIAAAQEQACDSSGRARLVEGHPGQVAQQIDGEGFVAPAD